MVWTRVVNPAEHAAWLTAISNKPKPDYQFSAPNSAPDEAGRIVRNAQRNAVKNLLECLAYNRTLGAAGLTEVGLSEDEMEVVRQLRALVRGTPLDLTLPPYQPKAKRRKS